MRYPNIIGIFFLLLLFIGKAATAQNLDIDLLRKINLERNTALDPTFKFVTNSVSPIGIAAPVIAFSTGYFTNDSALKMMGIYLAESVFVSGFVTISMKYTFQRDRPFITYPDIQKLTGAGSPSFPSGHTSEAFATATSLSLAFPKWYVIAPSMLWASAAGYSRMHLGVHYPSDVLVGALIGSGSAWLCHELNKRYFK
jgi:membrane-associated phospholipid phosphatase